MDNLLKIILKKDKAVTIIRNQVVEDRLTFRLLDYMDIDGNFKSLFICYNLEYVFTHNLQLLGELDSNSITDRIFKSVKVYYDKSSYLEDRFSLDSEYINYEFTRLESVISDLILSESNEYIKVRQVTISWFPILTIIVNFNINSKRQPAFVILPGKDILIHEVDSRVLKFKQTLISNFTKYRLEGI